MSFEDLYDYCFRNIGVIHLVASSKGNNEEQNELTTLDAVFASSRYVIFYLINSGSTRSLEPVSSLKKSPVRLRRFFGVSKKSKKKRLVEVDDVSVVIFDLDLHDDGQPHAAISDSGWYIIVPINIMAKSRLLRALRYCSTPSLIVLDASTRQIITDDGRRLLQDDPNGVNFPWCNATPEELFQGPVLRNCKRTDGTREIVTEDFKNLTSTVKGLYFGANWCPPCRSFSQQLVSCYESLKNAGVPFEIFFCSSDRSQESFEHHFLTMPWLAFPYDPQKTTQLTRLYSVNGIPAFLILNEENRLITRHGRNVLLSDPSGSLFPWGPLPLYELTENTLCRLRDEPSLVLFTEGSPDDVTFSMEVLRTTAESLFRERKESLKQSSSKETDNSDSNANGNGDSSNLTYSTNSVNSSISSDLSVPPWADPLQIFYTGEDPLCDFILEGLGLGNAELPVIVILDATVSRMCICEKPDVSAEIVAEFVADYKNGKLDMVPLPTTCQNNVQPIRYGGIPAQAVHQALGIGNSPSSNLILNDNQPATTSDQQIPIVL
uniref:Thioredoxin domain-containing protein n=1 Tax=Setaria digitata TaxID=48799 RepID=A0A915Q056_9BILA